MTTAAFIVILLVIMIHLYIVWLEMFAWTTRAPVVFKGFPKDYFEKTVTLAGNQGLYNGFLAAGLIWCLLIRDPLWSRNVGFFFLGCVAVAGIYGAATAQKKILYIQTVPAVVGILLIWLRM